MNVTKKDRQRLAKLTKSLRAGIPLVGFLSAQAASVDDATKEAWNAVSNAMDEVRLPVAPMGSPASGRIEVLSTPVIMGTIAATHVPLTRTAGALVDPEGFALIKRVGDLLRRMVQSQSLDGSWSEGNVRDTAYVILACQASVSSHCQTEIRKGLAFLVRAIAENRVSVEDESLLAYVLAEAFRTLREADIEEPLCRIFARMTAGDRVAFTPREAVLALAAVRTLRGDPVGFSDIRLGGLLERTMASVRVVRFGEADEDLACRCYLRMVDGGIASEEVSSDLVRIRAWQPGEREAWTEFVAGLCKQLMRTSRLASMEDRESMLRWTEGQRELLFSSDEGLSLQEQCLRILRATIRWQHLKCASREILSPTSRNAGLKQLPLPEVEVDI